MDDKLEGVALPPLSVAGVRLARSARTLSRPHRRGLPCPSCGAPVVEHDRRRICLRCGFMTGSSQGIERA